MTVAPVAQFTFAGDDVGLSSLIGPGTLVQDCDRDHSPETLLSVCPPNLTDRPLTTGADTLEFLD